MFYNTKKREKCHKRSSNKKIKLYALWKTSRTSEVIHTQGKNLKNSDKGKGGKTSNLVPSNQHF